MGKFDSHEPTCSGNMNIVPRNAPAHAVVVVAVILVVFVADILVVVVVVLVVVVVVVVGTLVVVSVIRPVAAVIRPVERLQELFFHPRRPLANAVGYYKSTTRS